MVSSSSSSSSLSSLSSFDDLTPKTNDTPCKSIKFLCSYNGKILPRYPDGKLRYLGGETRVLAVDRAIPYAELLVKMGELCGEGRQREVSLRCQLPTEDLDALVSVTSDEDLANLIEEYDLAGRRKGSSHLKVKAFLHFQPQEPPRRPPPAAPPRGSPVNKIPPCTGFPGRIATGGAPCCHKPWPQQGFPHHGRYAPAACGGHSGGGVVASPALYRQAQHVCVVRSGNHWQ